MIYRYDTSTGDLSGPSGSEGTYPDAAAAAGYLATLGEVFELLPGSAWSVRPTDHAHTVTKAEPLRLDYLRFEAAGAGVQANVRKVAGGVQFFADAPFSAEDRVTLDTVTAAHTGEYQTGDPLALRIGDHFSPPVRLTDPPFDVVWNVLAPKLHKRIGIRDGGGYVRRWDFVPITNGVRGPAVVCEHHDYTIPEPNAAPLKRDVEIEWLRQDGTGHPDRKRMEKWYDTPESVAKEGKKRREKLMADAQGTIYTWLLGNNFTFEDGKAFVTSISEHVSTYVEYSDMGILSAIQAADAQTFTWLDQAGAFSESLATPVRDGQPPSTTLVTPREFLLGILDIYATP